MRAFRSIALLPVALAAVGVLSTTPAPADVPRCFTYQGRISGVGPAATLRVRLWNDAAASAPANLLGVDETYASHPTPGGIFVVSVGSLTAGGVPDAALSATQVWVGVSVNGGAELTPRTPICALPFAMSSLSAERLVAPNSQTAAVSVDAIGNTGIGVATPSARLHVAPDSNANVGPWAVVQGGGGIFENVALRLYDQGTASANINVLEFAHGNAGTPAAIARIKSENVGLNAAGGGLLTLEARPSNTGAYNVNQLVLTNTGSVGIGTAAPGSRLSVLGSADFSGNSTGFTNGSNTVLVSHAAFQSSNTSASARLQVRATRDFLFGADVVTLGALGAAANADGSQFTFLDANTASTSLSLQTQGAERINVGALGTRVRCNSFNNLLLTGDLDDAYLDFVKPSGAAPSASVRFNGFSDANTHIGSIEFWTRDGGDAGVGLRAAVTAAGEVQVYNDAGASSIRLIGDTGNGTGRVVTNVLEITGGSDIAEPFNINSGDEATKRRSDDGRRGTSARNEHDGERDAIPVRASLLEVSPGMVVSIDPDRAGELRISAKAYDKAVAGVVSGANGVNPGMVLKQTGSAADGKHPVALTGRVYCWVDADAAPIAPGDLLTTSDTPGHAMRASDPDRTPGAVIGKAMTKLERGRGLVLVLVSLQ